MRKFRRVLCFTLVVVVALYTRNVNAQSKKNGVKRIINDYYYIDKENNIQLRSGADLPYYAFASTDYWDGMPDEYKIYIREPSIENQINNACYIEYYLTHHGIKKKKKWTRQAVAGLIGNIIQENRTNPGAWERWLVTKGSFSGYGLGQWTPSSLFFTRNKLTAIEANELANKQPIKMLKKQMNYLWKTMTSSDYKVNEWLSNMGVKSYNSPLNIKSRDYIVSKKSPKTLAKVFCSCYFRPNETNKQHEIRASRAYKWYKNRIITEE